MSLIKSTLDYDTKSRVELLKLLDARAILYTHCDRNNRGQLLQLIHKSDFIRRPEDLELGDLKAERRRLLKLRNRNYRLDRVTWEELITAKERVESHIKKLNERRLPDVLSKRTKKKIWSKLFNRSFRANPKKWSFTDLPREIRTLCYEKAFEALNDVRDIYYDPRLDRLACGEEDVLGFNSTIRLLLQLSTLSVQIRKEVRATFWSVAQFNIAAKAREGVVGSSYHCRSPQYMAVAERCLRGIGDSGCFGLKVLKIHGMRYMSWLGNATHDISESGHATFARVSRMLLNCVCLTTLHLTITEQYLLRDDQTALRAFFLHGEQLKSSGLQSFQETLQGLPMLQDAVIEMPYMEFWRSYEENFDAWEKMPHLLRYAFTQERRHKLWLSIRPILEATKLQLAHGRVRVELEKGYYTDGKVLCVEEDPKYEKWLASETKFIPGDYERWLETQRPT